MLTLDNKNSWDQLPKSLAGHVLSLKWFQMVMVNKLGLSLGGPLDSIYYDSNFLGNFQGTPPWSLQLNWPTAFFALRIVQPHLLPLPMEIHSRSLVI